MANRSSTVSAEQPWDWTTTSIVLYDPLVIHFANRFVWGCPSSRILAQYKRHITANHLDVGVGTGWYIHRCGFPSSDVRLALMDINRDSLSRASKRLERYRPEVYQANVLKPLGLDVKPFSSLSISYLLHCLPGNMQAKAVAFDHLKTVLEPGGMFFGSTLLSHGVRSSFNARRMMKRHNQAGMFSNSEDSLDSLRTELERRFEAVEIHTIGCVALFSARLG